MLSRSSLYPFYSIFEGKWQNILRYKGAQIASDMDGKVCDVEGCKDVASLSNLHHYPLQFLTK
jgi:hypothetical protein